MLSRLVQPSNARYPLLVTLAGMLTLTRLLQPLNEYCPKLATPSEITTSFTCSRWEYQGTALELFQFAIAPVPLMVRTPSSLSSQVRFSPQVPLLAARAGRARLGMRLSAIAKARARAAALRQNFCFILPIPFALFFLSPGCIRRVLPPRITARHSLKSL